MKSILLLLLPYVVTADQRNAVTFSYAPSTKLTSATMSYYTSITSEGLIYLYFAIKVKGFNPSDTN